MATSPSCRPVGARDLEDVFQTVALRVFVRKTSKFTHAPMLPLLLAEELARRLSPPAIRHCETKLAQSPTPELWNLGLRLFHHWLAYWMALRGLYVAALTRGAGEKTTEEAVATMMAKTTAICLLHRATAFESVII